MRGILRATAALMLVAGLAVTGGCSFGKDAGTVTVLASWTGGEGDAFRAVLDRFTDETGIHVDYQGTRALDQVLTAQVQRGTPPDVAVLPSLGALAGYVRAGAVYPVDGAQESDSPGWRRLERLEHDGASRRYAVVIKADLKSMIWFDPTRTKELHAGTPPTWGQLTALSHGFAAGGRSAWCVGLSAPPVSGWPGTDWIEDLVLHLLGPAAYAGWAGGTLPWTQTKPAWTALGDLLLAPGAVRGGAAGMVLNEPGDAGRPMYDPQPGCALQHQASFLLTDLASDPNKPQPGRNADFVPFPTADTGAVAGTGPAAPRSWEVSANLAGMFTKSDAARKLMRFLATDEAQRIWPAASGGQVFSVHKGVGDDVYTDPVSKRIAATLTGPDTLCFDASDLMPAAMTNAFYRAVLQYLTAPTTLDQILAQLDQVRAGVPPDEWLRVPCG